MDMAGNEVPSDHAHSLERKVPDERGRWLGRKPEYSLTTARRTGLRHMPERTVVTCPVELVHDTGRRPRNPNWLRHIRLERTVLQPVLQSPPQYTRTGSGR